MAGGEAVPFRLFFYKRDDVILFVGALHIETAPDPGYQDKAGEWRACDQKHPEIP